MKKIFSAVLGFMMCMILLCGCNIITCNQCNGEQEIICSVCDGTAKVKCTVCSGDMLEPCKRCSGDGQDFGECSNCNGSGKVYNPLTWEAFTCGTCEGEGATFYKCQSCNGSGNSSIKCTSCDKGEMYCFECLGLGTLPCSECNEEEYNKSIKAAEEKNKKYDEAVNTLKAYEYGDALAQFSELGDYRDSKAKVEEIEKLIEQTKYNFEYELEGDWGPVSTKETYFFSEEYGNEDGNLRIEKDGENSYDILYLYDSGSTSSWAKHSIEIIGDEFIFKTSTTELNDDTIKVYFSENGNLIFEKYRDGEIKPWSTFEAKKI